jgi:TetR/AcrR family transcriptional regulator, transcriptional repressor for nem operon
LLGDYEKALSTVLRGIVHPGKIDYFGQFLKRRTALAIKAVSPPVKQDISGG